MSEPVPVRREEQRAPGRQRPGEFWMDPFPDLSDLWDRMWRSTEWPVSPWSADAWRPLVDVEETDDAYVYEFELAGVRRDDIHVDVSDQELSISVEVKID